MRKYIVYKYLSKITGKVYIGITCQNPIKRWGAGNNYKGCHHFYSAILRYGWDSFEHIILYDNLSKKEAVKIEKSLIAYYKALDKSYNCCHNKRKLRGKVICKPTAYGYKWKFEDDLAL